MFDAAELPNDEEPPRCRRTRDGAPDGGSADARRRHLPLHHARHSSTTWSRPTASWPTKASVDGYGHVSVRNPANASRYFLRARERRRSSPLRTSSNTTSTATTVSGSPAGYHRALHPRADLQSAARCGGRRALPLPRRDSVCRHELCRCGRCTHMGYFIGEGVTRVRHPRRGAASPTCSSAPPALGQALALDTRGTFGRADARKRGSGRRGLTVTWSVAKAYYLNVERAPAVGGNAAAR